MRMYGWETVSSALRERLGHDATDGLLELFESEKIEWGQQMLNMSADRLSAAAERFEHRLNAGTERVEHRLNLATERYERRLAEEISGLRVALVREIHDDRVEMFKWAFAFWIGQAAALAGIVALMFRITGR